MASPYNVISAQTVPASASTGQFAWAQVVTKYPLALHAKITTGTPLTNAGKLYLRYVTSPYSITAANAVTQMVSWNTLEIIIPNNIPSGTVYYIDTGIFIGRGLNAYGWLDVPNALGQTITLDCELNECQ